MENNKIYVNVLKWLAIGLAVSFITGYLLSLYPSLILGIKFDVAFAIAAVCEFGIAIAFSLLLPKISSTTAKILYLVYAALTGLNFMIIFLIYEMSSIVLVFLVTSVVFALMALWGKNTKADLSKMGTYLFIALLGMLILEILNLLIFHLGTLETIISLAMVLIFVLYIGYDMKKAIALALTYEEAGEIYGAFELYLDFINLFLRLLQFFGKGKDD